jgi:hypothetical protein
MRIDDASNNLSELRLTVGNDPFRQALIDQFTELLLFFVKPVGNIAQDWDRIRKLSHEMPLLSN